MNRFLKLGFTGVLLTALATCAIPVFGQQGVLPNSNTGALGAANATLAVSPIGNGGTCTADVTGTWSGTITFQVIGQSNTPASATAYTWSSSTGATTTTSNGLFYWPSSGTQQCQVKMTSYVSGSAAVTISVSAGTAALPPAAASGGGVQPSPLYTTPVSCATPSCNVTTYQGTSPWVVSCTTASNCPNNSTIVAPTSAAGFVNVVQAAAPVGTSPVSCAAAANCPVNASQVTSPWVVTTPAPVGTIGVVPQAACAAAYPCGYPTPAPLATTPVTLPTVSPGGWAGHQLIKYGTNATYVDTIPDQANYSANIVTATTTLLVSGVANQNMYIYLAAWLSSGTNTAATVNYEIGQGATCGTNTKTLAPIALLSPTAVNEWQSFVAGSAGSAAAPSTVPAASYHPYIVQANATPYNLCGVTVGTTVAGYFYWWVAIHAN
jgi:hypothetical protein